MYRILIVDDEPYVTEGLRVSLHEDLDPERFELEAALSGAEALEKFARRDYDIVVTDVRMPGMDGIALQHELRDRYPQCRVIFLTGHGDFGLVRQAFRNQSVDYILKTEGDGEVVKALILVADQMDRERLDTHRRLRDEFLVNQAKAMVARRAVSDVLAGNGPGARESWQLLEPYGQVPRLDRPLHGVVLQADHQADLDLVILTAEQSLAVPVLGASIGGDQAVLLAQAPAGEPNGSRWLQTFLGGLQDAFFLDGNRPFSFALSLGGLPFEDLPSELDGLRRSLQDRRGLGGLALVGPRGGPQETVRLIDRHIAENLATDVSLSRLAEVAGMNPAYLSRWYLQETGVHLSETIALVRFNRAEAMLAASAKKVGDIARDIGFWTPSHFIRFFKKRSGMTPQAYRESRKP